MVFYMTRPFFRLLGTEHSSATGVVKQSSDTPGKIDSDFLVILTALLCALICLLGLIAVACCAQLRRLFTRAPLLPSAANRGVKKKILRSLPKQTFSADWGAKFSDCTICLVEFAVGDEIRVLPQCGHGFHVNCIDTWLGSHSSCPSCRQILVVTKRCQNCRGLPESGSSSLVDMEAGLKEQQEDVDGNNNNNKNNNSFLPYIS